MHVSITIERAQAGNIHPLVRAERQEMWLVVALKVR